MKKSFSLKEVKIVRNAYSFHGYTKYSGIAKDKFYIIHYLNGKIHREDGPAVEILGGKKEWWLNDTCFGYDDQYNKKSWIRFVNLLFLK